MVNPVSGSSVRKYSLITGLLFFALFLYYIISNKTNGILEFQTLTLCLCLIAIIIGTKCKKLSQVIIIVLIIQLYSLLGMSFYNPAEDIGDKESYESFVREMLKMNSFSDVVKPITNPEITSNGDISDMGYSLPLYFCVILLGWEGGLIAIGIIKLLCHIISVALVYKLFRGYIGVDNSLFVALLWGLNINNAFFMLAGLKESLFVIAVLYAVHRMYVQIQTPSIKNFILFLFASFLTILFRAVFPVFFIFTYIGYLVLFMIKSKIIRYLIVSITAVICLAVVWVLFNSSFQSVFIMMEEDEDFTKVPIYLKILNGLIYPYPSIRMDGTKANLLVSSYAAVHSSFALFAIMGIYRAILKEKCKELFPAFGVFIFNTMMLVITGFSMNIRFLYPTHILYYVFIPIGFAYYFKRIYYIPYLLLLFAIVFKYNQIL